MNKNILIGVAAFGGLALVASLALSNKNTEQVKEPQIVAPAPLSIPGDLPAFPIYTNSTVVTVTDTSGDTARDVSVSLSTTDTKNDIYDWYREALNSNGWSIKSDKNVAVYQIIQGENNNLYTSLQVASGSNENELIISQQMKVRK
jgi:hypothetical protein